MEYSSVWMRDPGATTPSMIGRMVSCWTLASVSHAFAGGLWSFGTARAMLGSGDAFDELPYFFTDQYDVGMEYVGLHDPGDTVIVRRKPEENQLVALWVGGDGRISAGMHVNDWDAIEPLKALVGTAPDTERLADDSVPLAQLAT